MHSEKPHTVHNNHAANSMVGCHSKHRAFLGVSPEFTFHFNILFPLTLSFVLRMQEKLKSFTIQPLH